MEITEEQFNGVITKIDTETNRVAAELRALKEDLRNKGLDSATEARIFGKFETLATSLEKVGKDEQTGGGETGGGETGGGETGGGTTPGGGTPGGETGGGETGSGSGAPIGDQL